MGNEAAETTNLQSPLTATAAGESGLAYASLVIGVLCISGSALFVKLAAVSGAASAFYRFFFASVILLPWWLYTSARFPRWEDLRLAAAGGLFLALDLFLWNTGIMKTTAATATLLGNTAPVWVGLGAWILFHERPGGRYWAGMAVALAGMVLVVGTSGLLAPVSWRGHFLSFTAAFFYAAYLLTTQHVRRRLDTLTFMTCSAVVGALVLFLCSLWIGVPLTGYSSESWRYLVALALISHLGGWLAVNHALGHLRASVVSVSLLAQVVVTVVLAIPVLGEVLSPFQVAGGILVLAGVYLVNSRWHSPGAARGASGKNPIEDG